MEDDMLRSNLLYELLHVENKFIKIYLRLSTQELSDREVKTSFFVAIYGLLVLTFGRNENCIAQYYMNLMLCVELV